MEASDLGAVRQLHTQLFPVRYEDSFFLGLVQRDRVLALVALSPNDDTVIGVATAVFKRKSLDFFKLGFGSATTLYVCTLGVVASHRREGVAGLLWERLIEGARLAVGELDAVGLHVETCNEAAGAFYKSRGLGVVKTCRAHYHLEGGRVSDAFKMGLALTDKGKDYLLRCQPWWVTEWIQSSCCPNESNLIVDDHSKSK